MKKYTEGDERTRNARTSQVYRPIMTALTSFANPPYSINLNAPPFVSFLKMVAGEVIDNNLQQWNPDWKGVIDATKVFKSQGIVLLGTK